MPEKAESSYGRDQLSEAESDALDRVLDDHFAVYGRMLPGLSLPLKGIVDEDFFGVSAGTGGRDPERYATFIDEMEMDGFSNDEIDEYIEYYLDESVAEDAPNWRSTNPFEFDLSGIEKFFKDQFQNALFYSGFESWNYGDGNVNAVEPETIVEYLDPFTKPWFEAMILCEIGQYHLSKEYMAKDNASPWLFSMIVSSVGKIGRLVEQYRWRFSYGADALRGRKLLSSAREGGAARSLAVSSRSQSILLEMSRSIAAGKTVSDAARLAHKAGYGRSFEANRKLWSRHGRKKLRHSSPKSQQE